MSDMKAFEDKLKATYPRCAKVRVDSEHWAYFRRPTQEEYDTLQGLSDGGIDEKRVAFRRYVEQCYCGSYPEGLSLQECIEIIGPAALNGPLGAAVNRLSGVDSEGHPTQLL